MVIRYVRLLLKKQTTMKNSKFIWGALLASMAFTACSEADKITDETDQEVVTSDGFKLLSSITFTSELGESESAPATRTPAAVNEKGRPTGEYLLPFVNVLKTDVTNQPTAADKGHLIELGYTNAEEERHDFVGGVKGKYNVLYKITEKENQVEGCSVQGTITLKQEGSSSNGITYALTVFADDVVGKEKITSNDFPYDKAVPEGKYRGSSMRYLTYNALAETQSAGTVTLPEITDEAIKSIVCKDGKTLYGEQADNLFLSNELLFCADANNIYVYEIIPYDNEFGGYELLRTYSRNENKSQPTAFKMERLTAIVSASFILVDEEDETFNPATSYFVEGNLNASADKFKTKFGTDLDLTTMNCRYATLDNMHTVYNINDRSDNNTNTPGRVLLWGDGYSVTGNDGVEYTWDMLSKLSADLSYNLSNGAAKGVGIAGMSYCAVYKGPQSATKGGPVKFYVTVGGKNIVITGIHSSGFAMNQNVAKHIILLVPAQAFADYYDGLPAPSRSGNNEYAEFVVSGENVIIK